MRNKNYFIARYCIIIVFSIITICHVNAQDSVSIKSLSKAVENLKRAMIDADSSTLDKLTYNELSYGHSGGQLQNKQEFIHAFTSHASVFVHIELTDQVITVMNDIGIVRHKLFAETNDKGKGPGTVKLAILLVWKQNLQGKWQLLARQAVKLPQ